MVRRYNRLLAACYVVADAGLGLLAFLVAYALRFYATPIQALVPVTKGVPPFQNYLYVMPFVAVLVPLAFQLQGLYRLRRGRSRVGDFFVVFVGRTLAVVVGVVATLCVQAFWGTATTVG